MHEAEESRRPGLRVLHIINDLRVGGAERLLTELVPRLRLAGIDASVAVLAAAPPGAFLLQRLQQGGDGLPPVPVQEHVSPVPLHSPRQVPRLASALAEVDIAHVHLFPSQLWAAAASQMLPARRRPHLVTTEHNTENRRRGSAVFRAADAYVYSRYERIVAISEATAAALRAWVPSAAGRIRVINNGVDVDAVSRTPPADRATLLGVGPQTPVVACIGRFVEQKDQATLIRALPEVPGLHAAFLGDGPMRPAAEALAAELGVADRTHFLGVRPDVPAVLRACDLYCQPSRWEGFGLAVVEAMAAGLPCLVTDVPGVVEVAGDAGISFPPREPRALASALRDLLADADRMDQLGTAGPRRAQLFGLDQYVADHLALYEGLAADG